MTAAWIGWLFQWRPVRSLTGLGFLARAGLYRLCGCRYRAVCDLCWVVRVSGVDCLQRFARRTLDRMLADGRHGDLRAWFLESSLSARSAAGYTISGGGPRDLFRDVIVLKAATEDEKGVILLKYGRTFEGIVAMFDLARLAQRYTFVLEPCWAGYCDPAILMFAMPGHPVVIQCFTQEDFAFIASVGRPFVPVRLGPADWVNADVFRDSPSLPKAYDLVMVANWGSHKRHAQLFRAVARIPDRELRLLLVGFPWAGRTMEDIRREASELGGPRVRLELHEHLAHADLAHRLSQCKVFIFLSKKEGDNKALVEALFADVPAIVYDRTVGGAAGRINPATGIFSSDEDLAHNICRMLDHHSEFHPRAWALEHTGSGVATRLLNEALSRATREAGGRYSGSIVEKTNAPNLAYRDPAHRERFQADYVYIRSCLRPRRARP